MFIVKIQDRDGQVRFIRVNAATPQEARQMAQSQAGGAQVAWALPPGHPNLSQDRDYAQQQGGGGFSFGGGTSRGRGAGRSFGTGGDSRAESEGVALGPQGQSFGDRLRRIIDPILPGDQTPGRPAIGLSGETDGGGNEFATRDPDPEPPPGIGSPGDVDAQRMDPAAAFRAFVQSLGGPTTGVAGNAILNAGQGANNIFNAQAALSGNATEDLTGFYNRVIGNNSVTRGLGDAARSALLGLANLGGGGNAIQQEFLNPSSYDDLGAQDLRFTALAAINPFLRDRFGGQVDQQLENRFRDLSFQRQQPMNLAAFLRDQLGIR